MSKVLNRHTMEMIDMNDKKIFGVAGLFDTPDDIIAAAKKTSEKYTRYDVHTPYPVHGMPKAMKLKWSPLGYFALAFGLTGTAIALLTMWWTMAVDYPLVIGGKPFFPLPAFIPVTFELTVLMASVGTVLTMLFLLFKFPNNAHPLHDTNYMKSVSVDKMGVCIEAKDSNFNEEEVKEFLKSIGAHTVETIYYDEEELNFKPKVFDKKFISLLVFSFIIVSASTYLLLNKLLYLPPFDWMMEQSKINAQSASVFFADGNGMQPPVEGTVARHQVPYKYADKPELAGEMMINPLSETKENLELGQKKFDIFCSPCHGFQAKGDSRLRGQFPNPPSLHSKKVREWKDGNIYHVIMNGQGVMPSYASQLSEKERWAVILYIRALQRALNAKEGDLQ